MEKISIKGEFIKLDQLLKFVGEASTGGEAKIMILEGIVKINNEIVLKRGKKIRKDDILDVNNNKYIIV